MKEGIHNESLKRAVAHLKHIRKIKYDKDIVERTGYAKGTVSEYIRGIEPVSEDFVDAFERKFNIKLKDFENDDLHEKPLSAQGLKITVQDYIDLLQRTNHQFYTLLSSSLGRIMEDQAIVVAYQKGWVDYISKKDSGGDGVKEQEIYNNLNKLVDDRLMGGVLKGTHEDEGKVRKP